MDDAISAGTAVRATLADLLACGAEPVTIGAFLQVGDPPGLGLPTESLAHLPCERWPSATCPLCAARVLLEDVEITSPVGPIGDRTGRGA